MEHQDIRNKILELTKEYYKAKFSENKFVPGRSRVNYAGRVFDENELVYLVDSSLDFWLTEGRYSEEFSEKIADILDVDNVILN